MLLVNILLLNSQIQKDLRELVTFFLCLLFSNTSLGFAGVYTRWKGHVFKINYKWLNYKWKGKCWKIHTRRVITASFLGGVERLTDHFLYRVQETQIESRCWQSTAKSRPTTYNRHLAPIRNIVRHMTTGEKLGASYRRHQLVSTLRPGPTGMLNICTKYL